MKTPQRVLVFVAAASMATASLGVLAPAAGAATAPAKWTASVCGAIEKWVDASDGAAETAAGSASADAKAAKRTLTKLVGAVDKATIAAANAVKKAGAPEATGGADVASTLKETFAQAKRNVAQAKKALKKASAKDAAQLVPAARGAQDAVEAGLEGLVNGLIAATPLDAPELVAAANAEASCAAVLAGDTLGLGVTLTPPSPAAGEEVAVAPSGVDEATAAECASSSTFVSELLGPDGTQLASGGETILVEGDPTGGSVRLVCYMPDDTGRRVIRGLCAGIGGSSGCAPAPRVVVSQGVIEVEQAISQGFNPVLSAIGG